MLVLVFLSLQTDGVCNLRTFVFIPFGLSTRDLRDLFYEYLISNILELELRKIPAGIFAKHFTARK